MIPKPDCVNEEHLKYLDGLRESGVTNMLGAGPYVERVFSLDAKTADTILGYWIESFEERHPDDQS